jgi:hypothetical protein
MQRPEFDITISRTGKVTVQVKGAPGSQCLQLADLIKEIVGREEARRLTAEYYAPDGRVRIDAQVRDRLGG